MIKHRKWHQKGSAVGIILGGLVALSALAYVASTMYATRTAGVQRTNLVVTNQQLLVQAANTVNSEATLTGAYPVAQAILVASPAPTGGGQIPTASGAQKLDAWGSAFGYCTNAASASSSPVYAVISAGPDKTFQTTCAQALVGTIVGDDAVIAKTSAQVLQGTSGNYYYGDPVPTLTALNALAIAHTDELRVVLNTGLLYENISGVPGAGNWTQVGGGTTTAPTNSLTQANCTAVNSTFAGGITTSVGGTWGTAAVSTGGCDWVYGGTWASRGFFGVILWKVPPGVYNISAVCIGAGGSYGAPNTSGTNSNSGGGAGLAYKNNIPVWPGNVIAINIPPWSAASVTGGKLVGTPGGDAYFGNYLWAGGGGAGSSTLGGAGGTGGLFAGDGGGPGGPGQTYSASMGSGPSGNYGGTCVNIPANSYSGASLYGSSNACSTSNFNGFGGLVGADIGQGAQGACRIVYPGNLRMFPNTLVGTP